jgi:hypothetical protein
VLGGSWEHPAVHRGEVAAANLSGTTIAGSGTQTGDGFSNDLSFDFDGSAT